MAPARGNSPRYCKWLGPFRDLDLSRLSDSSADSGRPRDQSSSFFEDANTPQVSGAVHFINRRQNGGYGSIRRISRTLPPEPFGNMPYVAVRRSTIGILQSKNGIRSMSAGAPSFASKCSTSGITPRWEFQRPLVRRNPKSAAAADATTGLKAILLRPDRWSYAVSFRSFRGQQSEAAVVIVKMAAITARDN